MRKGGGRHEQHGGEGGSGDAEARAEKEERRVNGGERTWERVHDMARWLAMNDDNFGSGGDEEHGEHQNMGTRF